MSVNKGHLLGSRSYSVLGGLVDVIRNQGCALRWVNRCPLRGTQTV
jgi:hypothetical protein